MDTFITTTGFDYYGNPQEDLPDINQSALDIRQFTEEQLHCIPLFFKAEIE